eukprot:Amastigsp_a680680_6.p2 type:complete len:141 gc:universal Amastigsp_a680680_6:209-631(+)
MHIVRVRGGNRVKDPRQNLQRQSGRSCARGRRARRHDPRDHQHRGHADTNFARHRSKQPRSKPARPSGEQLALERGSPRELQGAEIPPVEQFVLSNQNSALRHGLAHADVTYCGGGVEAQRTTRKQKQTDDVGVASSARR